MIFIAINCTFLNFPLSNSQLLEYVQAGSTSSERLNSEQELKGLRQRELDTLFNYEC